MLTLTEGTFQGPGFTLKPEDAMHAITETITEFSTREVDPVFGERLVMLAANTAKRIGMEYNESTRRIQEGDEWALVMVINLKFLYRTVGFDDGGTVQRALDILRRRHNSHSN